VSFCGYFGFIASRSSVVVRRCALICLLHPHKWSILFGDPDLACAHIFLTNYQTVTINEGALDTKLKFILLAILVTRRIGWQFKCFEVSFLIPKAA